MNIWFFRKCILEFMSTHVSSTVGYYARIALIRQSETDDWPTEGTPVYTGKTGRVYLMGMRVGQIREPGANANFAGVVASDCVQYEHSLNTMNVEVRMITLVVDGRIIFGDDTNTLIIAGRGIQPLLP